MRKFLTDRLGDINKDIGALKTPHERLAFRTYFFIVVLLATVVLLMWKIISNDQKDKVADLREQMIELKNECRIKNRQDSIQIERLRYYVDSLRTNLYDVVKEMYENRLETVNQRKLLIKNAKELLKK